MWKSFAPLLRCPLCRGQLELSSFEEARVDLEPRLIAQAKQQDLYCPGFDHRVEAGVLRCGACQVQYPIFEGLPCLLPYSTPLHVEFRSRHATRLADLGDYRFADREPVSGERFVLNSFSTEWLAYDFDGVIWEMDYADHERRFRAELGSYGPAKPGRFLELGCGIGITTAMAQRSFGGVAVGVDLSLAALKATAEHRNNPFLHFVQGSVFYLPFAEQSFDTVYTRGVLHHTYSTKQAFGSLARFAKPGGTKYVWVYGPKSRNDNLLRRILYGAETIVRRALRGRDSGVMANAVLYPLACAYVCFNFVRHLGNPAIQRYNLRRALHAARDRFTPEFAHRHSDAEVLSWFREAGFEDLEVVDWRAMPSADHDDYRRNTGVRGRKALGGATTAN